jgi:hypothetical protein
LDILKCIDSGEGHGEIACSLGLSCSTKQNKRVKIIEHVKSAGTIQSIMENPKQSTVIGEMQHLLKTLVDEEA